MKLRGSKVAVREFFVTLQNNVFPSVHPPIRSAYNRRYAAENGEEASDAIARREIKICHNLRSKKKLRADCFGVP